MAVDISNVSFKVAKAHHPKSVSAALGDKIVGAGNVTWSSSSDLQSCALRMSIALAWAGVHWTRTMTTRVWKLKNKNFYYPTYAGDYPDVPLLQGAEALTGTTQQNKDAIDGRKGVIYFGGNFSSASGHLTLWDGSSLHYPTIDNYWSQPNVYFWEMSD